MKCKTLTLITSLLAGSLGLGSAQAAFLTYQNEANFDAAVGAGLTIEDFNTDSGSGSPLTVSSGGLLTSVSSNADDIFRFETTHTATTGIGVADVGDGDWTMTFNFSQSTTAFGFDLHDYFEGVATMSFSTNAGESGLLKSASGLGDANTLFLGMVTDTAFTSFTLLTVGSENDGAQIDDVKYATSTVPLPGSLLLLGAGLLGLFGARARR
ncbi:MAG: PEP-CTERM sorting domain-containing protein [Gammaproteobacteria bacterium]